MDNIGQPIVFLGAVSHFGGAEESTILQIKELKKRNKVVVLDFYGCCKEYLSALAKYDIEYDIIMPNSKHYIIGGRKLFERSMMMLWALPEIIRLIKILKNKLLDLNPQIVWLNNEKSLFCTRRAIGNMFPVIIFFRARICKLKWYCIKDWKNINFIVANNSSNLAYFKKYQWACNKLGVAHNGVDYKSSINPGTLNSELPKMDSPFKVVMSAMLSPHKDHAVGIKGFASWIKAGNDGVLWICGDTPNNQSLDYENSLKKLVKDIEVDNKVFFLGYRSDMSAVINASDIMLHTSQLEGLPRSILQAMTLKKPILATGVDGIPELVRDGKDGILFNVGDINAVTGGLSALSNLELRQKMGDSAQRRVREDFTIQKMTKEFLSYIDKAIKSNQQKST